MCVTPVPNPLKPIPMPRYEKEVIAALKRVLMCRRDKGYRFNEGDLPGLIRETKLKRDEIIQWAVDKRTYYNSLVTPEAMETFLSRKDTVSVIKRLYTPVYTC